MGKTNIEWTNRTWNPIVGCSRVSEGCRNCYAERMAGTRLKHTERYKGLTKPGPDGPLWTGLTRWISKEFNQPQKWRDPQRIFVCDMGDLFHESVSDEQIRLVLQMPLRGAHRHTYQILTKRIDRARDFFAHFWNHCYQTPEGEWIPINPARNIWIGVSVEDPRYYDRIRILQQIPAAVRFLSLEPLLEAMPNLPLDGISWLIIGGESGPRRRPVNLDWMRDIRDQCKAAGIAYFCKQIDKKIPIPEDLMIREFPNGGRDA